MKFFSKHIKRVIFALGAFILSYYILMARQTILLATAIQSFQFWLMLVLGTICFYGYFSYSAFLNKKLQYSTRNSILVFLILRFSLGIWIPSAIILFLVKELFGLLGIDIMETGYMDTEYFILMIVLYSTTIAFIAMCFYNRYQQTQESLNILLSDTNHTIDSEANLPEDVTSGIAVNSSVIEIDKQETFKREMANMLLHVVLIRKRKSNIFLFRDDGTCELFVSDPLVIDLFIQENTIIQINRWIWVNAFYIKDIRRENNEDSIVLLEDLQEKFYNCKAFQEPNAQNQLGNKPSLYIGRSYKKDVKQWIKDNKGNIDA